MTTGAGAGADADADAGVTRRPWRRVAWATDIHLDFLDEGGVGKFAAEARDSGADALAVSGDLSDGTRLVPHLRRLREESGIPLLYVLGNHDFYKASFAAIRRAASTLNATGVGAVWLTGHEPILLEGAGKRVAIVGSDGWADGRAGDYDGSAIVLNDYLLIEEFRAILERHGLTKFWTGDPEADGLVKRERRALMEALAGESARSAREGLGRAMAAADEVWFFTHVPPSPESCWYKGKRSTDEWLPHFCSPTMGEALEEAARAWPGKRLEVFCGHVHSEGVWRGGPNWTVHTGGAVYGSPRVNRVLSVDD